MLGRKEVAAWVRLSVAALYAVLAHLPSAVAGRGQAGNRGPVQPPRSDLRRACGGRAGRQLSQRSSQCPRRAPCHLVWPVIANMNLAAAEERR